MKMIKGKYDKVSNYYDDSLRQKMELEQTITSDMESALANGEFEVYFQPKYDLLTDKVAGAEALVRWKHPVKGMISPGIFTPSAFLVFLPTLISSICKTSVFCLVFLFYTDVKTMSSIAVFRCFLRDNNTFIFQGFHQSAGKH